MLKMLSAKWHPFCLSLSAEKACTSHLGSPLVDWVGHCMLTHKDPGCCIIGYPSKLIANSNLVETRFPLTYFSVGKPFWNFAQSMAVILSCSVQNFKTICQLNWMLCTNENLQDVSFGGISQYCNSFQEWLFLAQNTGHLKHMGNPCSHLEWNLTWLGTMYKV